MQIDNKIEYDKHASWWIYRGYDAVIECTWSMTRLLSREHVHEFFTKQCDPSTHASSHQPENGYRAITWRNSFEWLIKILWIIEIHLSVIKLSPISFLSSLVNTRIWFRYRSKKKRKIILSKFSMMFRLCVSFAVFCVLCSKFSVLSYPQGAPVRTESCINLQPIHMDPMTNQQVPNQQGTTRPYRILVSQQQYQTCTSNQQCGLQPLQGSPLYFYCILKSKKWKSILFRIRNSSILKLHIVYLILY